MHKSNSNLRHGADTVKDIVESLSGKKIALFLDYDGTLTPIVSKPEDAVLSEEMKRLLEDLSAFITVAIVTGRDKSIITRLVGLPGLIYAGSHGYDITGPDGLHLEHPDKDKIIPGLDAIEKELGPLLVEKTEGTRLDRKKFAIGIHYRNARDEDQPVVEELASQMIRKYPGYKIGTGKKIVEIKPAADWHKGKAILWLMNQLGLEQSGVTPVFIGDDLTDEDGFEAIASHGIGILVGDHGNETSAHYRVSSVDDVKILLESFCEIFKTR